MMSSQPIAQVVIAVSDEAYADALHAALTPVHALRIVGSVWAPEDLAQAIRAFRATLVLAAPDFPVPDALGIPHLVLAPEADPVAQVEQYLAERQAKQPAPVQPAPAPAPSTASPGPHLNLPPPQRTVRLGFWGARGGVGTTTAALHTAAQLAERGFQVALCDATGRGDTFLWAGFKPQTQPQSHQGITFFPNLPPAEELQQFPAVVIDGGRKRRERNVAWVRVTAPMREEAIERWVDHPC
jgi:hypothetical protein